MSIIYLITSQNGQVVIETIDQADEIIQIRCFDHVMSDLKSSIIAKKVRDFAASC